MFASRLKMVLKHLQGGTNPSLDNNKLVVITPWKPPQAAIDKIQKQFPGLAIDFRNKNDLTKDEWKDVTVLLAGHNADDFPTLEEAPRLQYVQLSSAGANHLLELPLFTETDIGFCTANGVHGPQISEWVIATFLSHQHHLAYYLQRQAEAKWARTDLKTVDAVKQRVGILGYGSIGRQIARVSVAMGMEVYAYNLHPRSTPESKRDDGYSPPGIGDPEGIFPAKWFSGGSTEELHAFLGSGLDLLVVSMPLTPKTKGLISAPEFKVLSEKKTFLSNIGRGPIVNTDDLIEALDKGLIRGAALDVTDPEPLPDGHPLWKAKNVTVTPHVSGQSVNYNDRVWEILEHNLKRLSEGKDLSNRVDRKDGY